nr:DUF1039 domain-containing protein [Candidatus Hamiltonella defensa]
MPNINVRLTCHALLLHGLIET